MCDLGFFNSIDSQIPKLRPYDLDAFYAIVEKAHANYDASLLDGLYSSKIRVCKAILKAVPPGSNNYKMPHARDVTWVKKCAQNAPLRTEIMWLLFY